MREVLEMAAGFAGLATSYVLVPAFWAEMDEHRGSKAVDCPQARRTAFARTSDVRGALKCMGLPVRLRVLSCSLWPERSGCDQACLTSS